MADRVWNERELERRVNRRLSILRHAEEVSGSVAATCRYYGISRNCFYRWRRRYEAEGFEGLKDRFAPASPITARTRPRQTSRDSST